MLFEKFGEFDSAEELNRAAAAQLAEGDIDAIYGIAEENGIDREDAEDYIDGAAPELCTPIMAALGKLKVEAAELEPQEIMEDWLTYIRIQCAEHPETAEAVRKKEKRLRGCIAKLLVWSFKNAKDVDEKIVKAAGIKQGYPVKLGIPGMARARRIITEYYTGAGKLSHTRDLRRILPQASGAAKSSTMWETCWRRIAQRRRGQGCTAQSMSWTA